MHVYNKGMISRNIWLICGLVLECNGEIFSSPHFWVKKENHQSHGLLPDTNDPRLKRAVEQTVETERVWLQSEPKIDMIEEPNRKDNSEFDAYTSLKFDELGDCSDCESAAQGQSNMVQNRQNRSYDPRFGEQNKEEPFEWQLSDESVWKDNRGDNEDNQRRPVYDYRETRPAELNYKITKEYQGQRNYMNDRNPNINSREYQDGYTYRPDYISNGSYYNKFDHNADRYVNLRRDSFKRKTECPVCDARKECPVCDARKECPVCDAKKEFPIRDAKKTCPICDTKKDCPICDTKKDCPICDAKKECPVCDAKKECPVCDTKKDCPTVIIHHAPISCPPPTPCPIPEIPPALECPICKAEVVTTECPVLNESLTNSRPLIECPPCKETICPACKPSSCPPCRVTTCPACRCQEQPPCRVPKVKRPVTPLCPPNVPPPPCPKCQENSNSALPDQRLLAEQSNPIRWTLENDPSNEIEPSHESGNRQLISPVNENTKNVGIDKIEPTNNFKRDQLKEYKIEMDLKKNEYNLSHERSNPGLSRCGTLVETDPIVCKSCPKCPEKQSGMADLETNDIPETSLSLDAIKEFAPLDIPFELATDVQPKQVSHKFCCVYRYADSQGRRGCNVMKLCRNEKLVDDSEIRQAIDIATGRNYG